VSVFLRILEYYDGILIMTSNRVGTFDEAFKSRIQVSLHYEDLSKKSRKTIWSNFLAMLEEGEEDVNINDLESHLEEMASEEMNGRQIRNAMTTARQLALHREEQLQWEHLDQVLKTAREFNQYLKNVQGHTDKQWAREQRLR
jgi:SpoVK/Ycf46/Vps4 family AAA+-type ATPase